MKTAKPKKGPKPYRCRRYGILNPYGDVWSPETFNTMLAAREHVKRFWSNQPDHDLSKYEIVPVKVIVSAVT